MKTHYRSRAADVTEKQILSGIGIGLKLAKPFILAVKCPICCSELKIDSDRWLIKVRILMRFTICMLIEVPRFKF